MAGEEACVLVELNCLVVGLGYREGNCGKAGTDQMVDAMFEEGEAKALAAMGGGDAELRDVSYVVGYARA